MRGIGRLPLLLLLFWGLLVLGCSDQKQSDAKNDLRSALGVKNATQPLEFEFKPGYVGTKFVETTKGLAVTKDKITGLASKQVAKLSIDKVEYIQNYIFQKSDSSFLLLENRDLLIRVHAYANISNIAAPDMRITLDGPGNIHYAERLGATGGLPAIPENSNQSVNYTLSPFIQAYLFKVPAQHIKPGEYKIKLEPLIKPDSGLSGTTFADTFTISEEPPPISIQLYQGYYGKKMARLPDSGAIIQQLRQYWPVGKINVELISTPIMVETFDIPNLNALALETKDMKEHLYPESKFVTLFQKTAEALNQTRLLTESSAIQILFVPAPEGSAHSMQSIAVADEHWEQQLARQFGHALGLGMSKQCAAPPLPPSGTPAEKAAPEKTASIDKSEKYKLDEDKGDYTTQPIEDYIWERRYWNLSWTFNKLQLTPPSENDLMSTCKTTHFPHPFLYRKAFINQITPIAGQPLLNHPSKSIKDYYAQNGLAYGPALHVELNFEELRRTLIQKEFQNLPKPSWASYGELARLFRSNQLRSPHAIVVEGGSESNPTQKIIGLYLSKDKKSLVGVTNLIDLPIPIKQYRLWINKTPIANNTFQSPFNKYDTPAAKAGRKDGFYLFAWNAKEIYKTFPATLIQKIPGKKTTILGLSLTRGTLKIPSRIAPETGKFYLLLPIKDELNGLNLGNLPIFSAEFAAPPSPKPTLSAPPTDTNPMNPYVPNK